MARYILEKMPEAKTPLRIEVSYKTIVFTLLVLVGLWFIIQVKEIIIFLFISLILLSALLKPVEKLTSKGIPKVVSVLITYLFVIAFISIIFGVIVPPLVSQTADLIYRLPQIITSINHFLVFYKIPVQDFSQIVARDIQQIAGNLIAISSAIFSSIFFFITTFVFTFYLLLEWKNFVRLISSPFSPRQEKKVASAITSIENALGNWVRGQLTLSFAVGILTYIGLRIIDIPYALPLALVAGILEVVPIVGPIMSAIPAVLVGLSVAPIMALATAALFLIVQQLENHLIVPMIMSKVVGLQPPIVILALLVGAKLNGIGGAFLAVPVVIVARILFREFVLEGHIDSSKLQEEEED